MSGGAILLILLLAGGAFFYIKSKEDALAESEQDIANTDRAIRGFDETVPDNLGEQFAQD